MSMRLLAAFTVFFSAATALAEYQLIEDYSSLIPGDIDEQSDWIASAGTAEVALDPDDANNQVMAVHTNSGIVRYPLAVANDETHMLFFRLRFAVQQKYSIGLSPLTYPSEFSDFGPELGMANESNDLHVWDDEANPNYVELDTLNQDNWYNVWMWIDSANDQYKVWVNDASACYADAGDMLSDGDNDLFDFRISGLSDFVKFYIKTGGGGAPGAPDGPVYIDDIYLNITDGEFNLNNPTALIGDVDGDGFVGLKDLDIILNNWNQAIPPADPRADLTGDDYVGLDDLDIILIGWNTGTPPASVVVPEPGLLAFLLPVFGGAVLRRGQSR